MLRRGPTSYVPDCVETCGTLGIGTGLDHPRTVEHRSWLAGRFQTCPQAVVLLQPARPVQQAP